LSGGFGRALVFLNFPVALIAVPLAVLSADRARGRAGLVGLAIMSAALCAVIFWPGIVDQADLDAKPANAVPAIGVALAVVVSAASGLVRERASVSAATAVFAVLLLVLALPWLAADLGFYLDGVPALGWLFRTGDLYDGLPSVHHGHHHGLDGVLLALTALLTVRLVRGTASNRLRAIVGAYVGLQLAYGLANVTNDAWLEQFVKRGWVSTAVPSVLNPTISLAWLGIVLAAAVFAVVILKMGQHG
jgi:hypothetical protein